MYQHLLCTHIITFPLTHPDEVATTCPIRRVGKLRLRVDKSLVQGYTARASWDLNLRSQRPGRRTQWGRKGLTPTILVPVLAAGADPAAQDLDVLPAGPAVELVLTDLPPAQLVSHGALVPHVLVKIRRRVILPLCGYQGKNSVNLLWVTPPQVHPGEGCGGECGEGRSFAL